MEAPPERDEAPPPVTETLPTVKLFSIRPALAASMP